MKRVKNRLWNAPPHPHKPRSLSERQRKRVANDPALIHAAKTYDRTVILSELKKYEPRDFILHDIFKDIF